MITIYEEDLSDALLKLAQLSQMQRGKGESDIAIQLSIEKLADRSSDPDAVRRAWGRANDSVTAYREHYLPRMMKQNEKLRRT